MLFSQFDASEHATLVSRVTADANHRVNEMSRISGNESLLAAAEAPPISQYTGDKFFQRSQGIDPRTYSN